MIAELAGAVQSVQALSSLLKAANGLSNYNEIVEKVSEVSARLMIANSVALSSQEKQLQMGTRIEELQKELEASKSWKLEASEYEIIEIARGVFVQLKKDHIGAFESNQKLCANCFAQGMKSFLQQSIEEMRQRGLSCAKCKFKIVFQNYLDVI